MNTGEIRRTAKRAVPFVVVAGAFPGRLGLVQTLPLRAGGVDEGTPSLAVLGEVYATLGVATLAASDLGEAVADLEPGELEDIAGRVEAWLEADPVRSQEAEASEDLALQAIEDLQDKIRGIELT